MNAGKRMIVGLVLLCCTAAKSRAQQVDSIYFHLYTDSLKKGVYNYINVDGLLRNGNYYPLDSSHLIFTSSDGKWIGNNLILDKNFDKKFVTVTATLKKNPALQKTVTIYIKQKPDDEKLKTEEEILNDMKGNKGRNKHT